MLFLEERERERERERVCARYQFARLLEATTGGIQHGARLLSPTYAAAMYNGSLVPPWNLKNKESTGCVCARVRVCGIAKVACVARNSGIVH